MSTSYQSRLSTDTSDPKLRSAAVRGLGLPWPPTADFASNPLHVSCSNPLGQGRESFAQRNRMVYVYIARVP